eukprot:363516-Chlamydomonas_euryale.AAC.29
MPLVPVLAAMEARGMAVHVPTFAEERGPLEAQVGGNAGGTSGGGGALQAQVCGGARDAGVGAADITGHDPACLCGSELQAASYPRPKKARCVCTGLASSECVVGGGREDTAYPSVQPRIQGIHTFPNASPDVHHAV